MQVAIRYRSSTFPRQQYCKIRNVMQAINFTGTADLKPFLSLYKWIKAYRTIRLFRLKILTKAKNDR
jgi:hypothetical protein